MREPLAYLAYALRGRGLLCAVCLFTVEKSVYGWYTGAQEAVFPAAFFMLEDYYSARDTVFYQSQEDDVYGGWAIVDPGGGLKLDQPVPVPQELCHELERMQNVFAQEWLFYADDPASQAEMEGYRKEELPVRLVNIKRRKLSKLERHDAIWTYATPGMDLNIIDFLKKRWSLDYNA